MSKKESLLRYSLIVNRLRKHPATFVEIAAHLAYESEVHDYNLNVSKRTFQRDLNDIRSLYNIDIQYNNSEKVYVIDLDGENDVKERMLEAFDTFNALNLSDKLSNHIHFEKRRPQGTEHLHGLLHAINNRSQIKFIYQKFWEEELTQRKVEPFALKEARNRWYVLANDLNDQQIKSFALDRITDLDVLKKKIERPINFDVKEHYRYSFGIIGPNGQKPEVLLLSFNPFQGKYIKSLPLHESQEVIADNDKETLIKLKLCITHDLFMELLSFGSNMKVIKPKSLVDRIKMAHESASKQY